MDYTISFTNNTVVNKRGQIDNSRTDNLKRYMTPPDKVREKCELNLPDNIDGVPRADFIEQHYLISLAAVLDLNQNTFQLSPKSIRKLRPEK
tara:strand:+ start:67 stop:342 length:276 start_codon:yes stop_codon:yes gene_type:complete